MWICKQSVYFIGIHVPLLYCAVFGVDLTTVAVMDDADVPKVVQECVQAIESTGMPLLLHPKLYTLPSNASN